MLGKAKQKTKEQGAPLLDVTASMQGSLIFMEPVVLRINGKFEGSLETRGDLTIGEEAVVQANIIGDEITIKGRVNGKIVAKRQLKLVPPAVLTGEIWAPILQVEPGARLDGAIHMTEEAKGRMTPEEVAEYLEIEVHLVQQWAREGKIPAVQEAGQWRFEKATIDAWVGAQRSS